MNPNTMKDSGHDDTIQWRIHCRSSPEEVYGILATDEGRRRFWAEETTETDGVLRFRFTNGEILESRILEKDRPRRFALTYFDDSTVTFDLADDGKGGTDLTMTESGVPESNRPAHLPGWVSVLLSLKAAVDFSVDLRNSDPGRRWEDGFVDV